MDAQRGRILERACRPARQTPRARVSSASRTKAKGKGAPGTARAGNTAARRRIAMTRKRWKHKGRSESGGYLALPHSVMASPNFRAASAHAIKLLNDLGFQYRGGNNGDLSAAWRIMQPRGWKSRDTLARAIRELLELGLIEKTRQGGLHLCSLFALTWLAIDECGGKLDVPATHAPSGLWRSPRPAEKQNASTATVSIKHGYRVNSSKAA
jgi:hypothetical protein